LPSCRGSGLSDRCGGDFQPAEEDEPSASKRRVQLYGGVQSGREIAYR
jgi:hypothetical protein